MIRLLSGAIFAAALLFSSVAAATNGYVCQVRRVATTSHGVAGSTYVAYYSQPACQGSLLGGRYYCSTSATSGLCTSTSAYWYTEAQLNTFVTLFQTAALNGSKVNYSDVTCVGGSSSDCGGFFYVYATL